MKSTILILCGLVFFTLKNQAQTVTDIDGNVYDTVTIGAQVWLKENLKVTHYRNGDLIPNITESTEWINLSDGARCYYNNDSASTDSIYGALYNWYTVNDTRNICPVGWHVPTDSEWATLTTYLGGLNIAGGKLKEMDTIHWLSPNTDATNESGFTALPGGFRDFDDGAFLVLHEYGTWWSSSSNGASTAWGRDILYNSSIVNNSAYRKKIGFSIRCLKDINSGIESNYFDEKINIYPNPLMDNISVNCSENDNIKMKVYSIIGECVLQKELHSGTNNIDLSSLTKGIYIINLSSDKWAVQKKLIKE